MVSSFLEILGLLVLAFALVWFGWNAFSNLIRPYLIFHIEPLLFSFLRTDVEYDDAKGFYINTIKLQGGVLAGHLRQAERETAVLQLKEIAIRNADTKLGEDIVYVLTRSLLWQENISLKRKIAKTLFEVLGLIRDNSQPSRLMEWSSRFVRGAHLAIFLLISESVLIVATWERFQHFNVSWIILAWVSLSLLAAPTVYVPLYSIWITRGKTTDATLYSLAYSALNFLVLGGLMAGYSSLNHFGSQEKSTMVAGSATFSIEAPEWITEGDIVDSTQTYCKNRPLTLSIDSNEELSRLYFDEVGLFVEPDILNLYDQNCQPIVRPIWKIDGQQTRWSKVIYISPKSYKDLHSNGPIVVSVIPYESNTALESIADLNSTIFVEHPLWFELRSNLGKYSLVTLGVGAAIALITWLVKRQQS